MTEDNSTSEQNKNSHSIDVWKGIGLTMLLHLILLAYPMSYILIGVVQLIYVVPALIWARHRTGIMQGIIIAAALTFLLNAACFGIVMAQF